MIAPDIRLEDGVYGRSIIASDLAKAFKKSNWPEEEQGKRRLLVQRRVS